MIILSSVSTCFPIVNFTFGFRSPKLSVNVFEDVIFLSMTISSTLVSPLNVPLVEFDDAPIVSAAFVADAGNSSFLTPLLLQNA